ncbi:MAG: hypothetical protein R2695_17890 [Acidimicrobiales bacterium]
MTHSHPDHFGGADQLHEEAGAAVLTHESFRSLVTETNDEVDLDLLDADEETLVEIWKQRFAVLEPTPWGTQARAAARRGDPPLDHDG